MFRNRKVFLQYGGVVELSRLQANVMQLHRPIITIFTLLEDLKYLESCSKSLRLIFNPASGQSMRVCMKECWKSPKRILQIQEFDEFQPLSELMNHEELFSAVYLQIWIYAMRNFHMLSNSPRKDPGYPKPQFKGTHPFFAFRLALLARELGFENTLVDEILHENAYRNVARAVLSDLLSVDTSISELEPTAILDRLGDSIKDALERIHGPITIEHPSVLESTNNIVKLKRCGRPYMQSHQNDRNHLYLRQIVNLEEPSSSITSIHVKRAFIFNFWGGFLSGITTGALLASNRNPDHERDTAEHSAGNQPTIRVEQMEIDGSRSDTQAGPERRKGTNKRDHASAPMQNALEVGPRETRAKAAKRLVQDNGVYNIFAITNNALIVGVDDHNYQGSISFSVSGSRYQLHFHKNLVQSRIIDLSGSYNLTDCIYLRNGKSYQNKQASQAFALSEGIANIVLVPKNLGPANIIHQVIPEVHSQLGDDLFNILRRKLDRRTE
ncbi:hypothetical protein AOL_s00088g12 [Orbilia oligospora ATCC 24927]|uniref:Uncharacterized protein n=1 Tax=Arthrobotrys oligospora (strain ATCC 24927 / CBS 115.81 / DSM 1491) TaxID=756982 RepID=G1XHP9_ARTOA|nr:hypothetical protein AOL_s00088g12 [Orbilia oligospora ATCC 24927]EGX47297.1 hypothetical protein AOL_s00088g12 [Orbilia oligospora ATCC 24927]